jgi:hypothetical protein
LASHRPSREPNFDRSFGRLSYCANAAELTTKSNANIEMRFNILNTLNILKFLCVSLTPYSEQENTPGQYLPRIVKQATKQV